jgi:hypothetical protein
MQLTTQASSYAGSSVKKTVIAKPGFELSKMSASDKVARSLERIRKR